ncbi:diphosphomevalonate decarboxylase-like isoform X2 [Mizuhopecten yessoensis]|uniref:diphosphomevalonate decarboxylase-like isoform X2 n=1 Tax=Mizuhopecten yessoensis TaxID=6573 RepID=UPI000B45B03F|nr:diphosphomevalonate decarboxylase-like isoform X2 [Mizuhopecten yessoensis]
MFCSRGKSDEALLLPANSSVSVTLHQDQLQAQTTVAASHHFEKDRIWLNGQEQCINNPRIQNVIREIKRRARKQKTDSRDIAAERLNWKIHICSKNNFPTAAGLASSAAGYACLVYALKCLYKLEGDVSAIARCGSGSACRSVHGGFVVWDKGQRLDGSDSMARQIQPHTHWPDLRVLILVVNEQKKHTGSTEGMQVTMATSQLLKERIRSVPDKIEQITQAIHDRDFKTFAEITMKDSNQMHACCLDTYPPISYLTDVSRRIIHLVHCFNKHRQETTVAYTFDAGPNACLFLLKKDVKKFLHLVKRFFPPKTEEQDFIRGNTKQLMENLSNDCEEDLSYFPFDPMEDSLRYIIYTTPGPGPQELPSDQSLLGEDGLPKSLS